MTEKEFIALRNEMLKNNIHNIFIERIDRGVYKGRDNSLVTISLGNTFLGNGLIVQWSPTGRFKELSEITFFDSGRYEVTLFPISPEGYTPTLEDLSTLIDTLLDSEDFQIKRN